MAKRNEPQLVEGKSPAAMPPPNHLAQLADCEDMDHLGLYMRWPLAMLMADGEDDLVGVFVDTERHLTNARYEWKDHPPTWMDPHVFADMVMKDERVQKILRVAMKKNDPGAWERILRLIDGIFDEQYLPYVLEKFEVAAPILAQWILRCHAYRETMPKEKKTRRKR